jgi:EAL domain-containing protein (putative c-di-GMP-specific phosphodiesterase class I)/DNA-binding NarL/FixJ family response regulator
MERICGFTASGWRRRRRKAEHTAAPMLPPIRSPPAQGRGVAKARLLILDDDPYIGKMMQLIAEPVGLEARFVTRTAEFFEAVDDWHPTHIAIDLVMPEMDGVEVLVKLADRKCGAKIIITSGVGTRVLDAAARSANEHGLRIVGALSKPFSPRSFRTLLIDVPAVDEGRDNKSLYATSPAETADSSAASAFKLRRALDNRELTLVYQPQIHLKSGDVAGFEALARWVHPARGTIMPDQFIPCAETHGLIHEFTDQVLALALNWYKGRFAGSELTVSANLSCKSASGSPFHGEHDKAGTDGGFVDGLTSRCRDGGIKPECLILELTETSAMDNPVMSLDLLTRLRMKGFQLSIDDFGTGYSSMLQLVRLPFSEIKVDRSFVMTAMRSNESRVVIECIIGLGHSLGLRVVAEGVEDAETMRYLQEAGCDLAQGYFIARPMSGEAAVAWIDSDARRFKAGAAQGLLL